jgi:hypothetical protein
VVDHPVNYRVDPPEGARNRLTVAFRFILAIPHILLVGGPGVGIGGSGSRTGVLGAVAGVCAFINWFAIVFTGRAIKGLLDLSRFYLRWRANALAYEALLRDEYPPFGDGEYPVSADLPFVEEGRNRWTVGFRLILIIPHVIVLFFLLIAWFVTALIGWFAVLFTGRYPEGLWRFGEGVMRWALRVEAYLLLMHDEYPPFSLRREVPSS